MQIWRTPRPGAVARLLAAHPVVGGGVALLLRSGLGGAPWDVFHVGVHRATGLSVGAATNLTALAAVLAAGAAGVRPGAATVVNLLILGIFVDAALGWVPAASTTLAGLGYLAAGTALVGAGTGLYLSAGLGSGPRDSLMLALAQRGGWPLARSRTVVEVLALAAGYLLGGPVGVGTLLFALAVGPATRWGITLFREEA